MAVSADSNDVILVIRLGAMGDILHALPAVASLKRSFPHRKLVWLLSPKWMPLLEGNPFIDEFVEFERGSLGALRQTWSRLKSLKPSLAIDFQGLVQSALAGRITGAKRFFGFTRSVAREPLAARFYSFPTPVHGPHRIERNLQLVQAAGATDLTLDSWIPDGRDEGSLPKSPFVLVSPFAGWAGKQWPVNAYEALGERLGRHGLQLVANVSAGQCEQLAHLKNLHLHSSSIGGLIAATRGATAVLGLDSGPLHLAAALKKPGVALFGPTDPAQTGPFSNTFTVIRTNTVATTYKRHSDVHESMKEITVDQVANALLQKVYSAQDSDVKLGVRRS